MDQNASVREVHGVRLDEEWEAIKTAFDTGEPVPYDHRARVWVAVPDVIAETRRKAPSGRGHLVTCIDCGWTVRGSKADPVLPFCGRCVSARQRGGRPTVTYFDGTVRVRVRLAIDRRRDPCEEGYDRWALLIPCGDRRMPHGARAVCEGDEP